MYFKVVDPKLQVADLKAEVGELRSGWIPSYLIPGRGGFKTVAPFLPG